MGESVGRVYVQKKFRFYMLLFPVLVGIAGIDQVLNVLLTTAMFVGGCVAFILDNTIPGQCLSFPENAFSLFQVKASILLNIYKTASKNHARTVVFRYF